MSLADALAETLRARRHPLEVTSDRLAEHANDYYDQLTVADRNAIRQLREAFAALADRGARPNRGT